MPTKDNLSGILAGAAVLTLMGGSVQALKPYEVSRLEVAASAQDSQAARPKEFDMLWKEKDDKYYARVIANGIFLEQQVASGDPNYKVELRHIGRIGKDNLLTEWEIIATVFSVSGGPPDSLLSRTGRVNSDGRFVLDDAKAEVSGKAYNLATNALSSSVLMKVQNGNPDLVKYWVRRDTTKKYEALGK